MSLRDALALKNVHCKIGELEFQLRRPSVADLAEASDIAKNKPNDFACWMICNHLLEPNGDKVFQSLEQVKSCDAALVEQICNEIDKLYGEGGNSVPQQ
jgi:hypothetical protein